MLATLHFRDRRGEASLRFISEIAPDEDPHTFPLFQGNRSEFSFESKYIFI